jgi:Protein of unknown function (DUF4242)
MNIKQEFIMRRYIIERSLPGIGGLTAAQLRDAAAKSNAALAQLGKDVQWVESYVAGDQTYCVYLAKEEAIIRKHAELSGFPANRIVEVKGVISPTTASAG